MSRGYGPRHCQRHQVHRRPKLAAQNEGQSRRADQLDASPLLERLHAENRLQRFFFPSPEGRLWDPDNFSQDLRAANQAAHLPWGCLDYRHTFGSQLAMKGESLYKISMLMGNSPEICRRHYAALSPESIAASVEFPDYALPTTTDEPLPYFRATHA